jgi:hypothetical protein
LVTTSIPAIDPAISTLPVMNQLIANVSSVPNVRQLTALRTDLVCVSAPRNKITRCNSLADDDRAYHAGAFRPLPRELHWKYRMDRASECVHFAERNWQTF